MLIDDCRRVLLGVPLPAHDHDVLQQPGLLHQRTVHGSSCRLLSRLALAVFKPLRVRLLTLSGCCDTVCAASADFHLRLLRDALLRREPLRAVQPALHLQRGLQHHGGLHGLADRAAARHGGRGRVGMAGWGLCPCLLVPSRSADVIDLLLSLSADFIVSCVVSIRSSCCNQSPFSTCANKVCVAQQTVTYSWVTSGWSACSVSSASFIRACCTTLY